MEDVQAALGQLVAEIGHAINAAQDLGDVILPLRSLALLLRESALETSLSETSSANVSSLKTLDEISAVCKEKALKSFPKVSSEMTLSQAFYGGPCFAALAQLLLHKVATDWLACFPLMEQTFLFDDFFIHSPPSESVAVLVDAMSSEQISEDNETYPAYDSPSAACAQAERLLVLLLISKQGVKKLAISYSAQMDMLQEVGANPRVTLNGNLREILNLAQLVSSMPDRARLKSPTALQSALYIQSVTSQLLAAAQENWRFLSSSNRASQGSPNDGTLLFIGEVIGRLCRRGHTDVFISQMASSLLDHVVTTMTSNEVELAGNQCSQPSSEQIIEKLQMSIWPSLTNSITDSHAMERFTEALLKEIASKGDVTDWEAYCILHTLYGQLWKERASLRSLFTEKFLFGKVLPIRCLKWILEFSILCSPSPPASEGWVQVVNTENTAQKDAVRHLSEVWAMKDFIQSASLQQQAYITAALGICLGSIKKDTLEGINGLMPSLLKGVSNRLDSPLNPVRQMAKSIALAFSIVMDSGKPLLFDEEDTLEELLNWEHLEGMISPNSKTPDAKVEMKQITANVEKELDSGHRVTDDNGDKDKRRERREQRKAKKEKLALEEEDPDEIVRLGEETLDESDLSSESESESESVSTLRPYDMSDDEVDGEKERVGIQLTDLATNLRKSDKPDAVEDALEVAEKLVLAMPVELDNMAADLTHALVHVKCSAVTVEGEEDIAEQRRHRALVALLSCSPVHSVSILNKEIFSQHVDASQRILILDVMAAGARALASGIHGNKSSDEDRRTRLITSIPGTADSNAWYVPGGGSGPVGAGPWVEVSSPMPGDSLVGWAHTYERDLPLRQGQKLLGRSRRWGQQAMQLRKDERISTPNQPQNNKFATLAAAFMLPIMRDYDKKMQHLELLGRDFLILGGILSMLGVCMQCIAMHQEASILGAGLLEMLRSREISSHPEVYVRRMALFAASRVLVALHPSDVAASLTSGISSIAANLEWVREWALEIAINDTDTECSMMATACVQLHSEMALQVQRSIGSLEPSVQSLEAKIMSRPTIIMPF